MKTFNLTNNFHGTEVTVRATAGKSANEFRLSPSQMSRVRKSLCGISTCTCGVVRGPQDGLAEQYDDGQGGRILIAEQD